MRTLAELRTARANKGWRTQNKRYLRQQGTIYRNIDSLVASIRQALVTGDPQRAYEAALHLGTAARVLQEPERG